MEQMRFLKAMGYVAALVFFLYGCKGPQDITQSEPMEERELEEIVVVPEVQQPEINLELPPYNPSPTRSNDLLHTKLELSFNWDKQHVLGKAWIDVKPLFYDVNTLTLDAKGFDIHEVKVDNRKASYDYDDAKEILDIKLGKTYTAKEQYQVYIAYTAKPNERKYGGSEAITSEKGLFFINPLGKEGDKPQQIWTQGETENNSAWFPTVDKPNERMTQEIYLTVRDEFETLSNGLLKSSKKNPDGTRTDHWLMDMPHAPYLVMLAIGDFAVVEETWRGKLLQYYVEHEYKDHAKAIYAHTPEMLTFFSDYLGVEYPWQKYSQVVVRDYVSGAMENTTAVIFGDFVQLTERELIDNSNNERIVAHEMMHHWFGDLVTCESWANLSMNEGFANYSEYLWFEHKHGRDAADHHLMNEIEGYLVSSLQSGKHPLIHFGYTDKEDMFDAHSYNKGGAILHMLRKTVGDEAFRAGLKKYLEDNQFEDVEAHELRLAMEDVTGRDLNWFFNQWYFEAGHPQLEIEYGYDASSKEATVYIQQTQDPVENPPVFVLPMAVDIYLAEGQAPSRHSITIDQRKQEFRFPAATAPKLVVADAEHYLLAEINENRSPEAYAFQFYNAPLFVDRYSALDALGNNSSEQAQKVRKDALADPHWAIRNAALNKVEIADDPVLAAVARLAQNDPHSQVRSTALLALGQTGNTQYIPTAKAAIDNGRAYPVVAAGLDALVSLDKEEATRYAAKLEQEENASILASVGNIYKDSGDVSKIPFFSKNLSKMSGYAGINFYMAYAEMAMSAGTDAMQDAAKDMEAYALNQAESPWRRVAATNAIDALYRSFKDGGDTDNAMKMKKMITDIKAGETNSQLKSMYGRYGN